jgi:hypothetical protein
MKIKVDLNGFVTADGEHIGSMERIDQRNWYFRPRRDTFPMRRTRREALLEDAEDFAKYLASKGHIDPKGAGK